MAIKRVWHGWTTPENADDDQLFLRDEVFPGIEAERIPGYRSIELMRRDTTDEFEFVTVVTFDSMRNFVDFQREDYARCSIPEATQSLLERRDRVSTHCELVESRRYA